MNKAMKIYTKKGDGGETDLFDPATSSKVRITKDNAVLEAIGTLDEVGSILGIIKSLLKEKSHFNLIERIQKDLFSLSSILAGVKFPFGKAKTNFLEGQIDTRSKKLPLLKNFILPNGNLVSAHLHFARSVVRRAERRIVAIPNIKNKTNVLSYVNRLSDLLFVLARELNYQIKEKEKIWSGKPQP